MPVVTLLFLHIFFAQKEKISFFIYFLSWRDAKPPPLGAQGGSCVCMKVSNVGSVLGWLWYRGVREAEGSGG